MVISFPELKHLERTGGLQLFGLISPSAYEFHLTHGLISLTKST